LQSSTSMESYSSMDDNIKATEPATKGTRKNAKSTSREVIQTKPKSTGARHGVYISPKKRTRGSSHEEKKERASRKKHAKQDTEAHKKTIPVQPESGSTVVTRNGRADAIACENANRIQDHDKQQLLPKETIVSDNESVDSSSTSNTASDGAIEKACDPGRASPQANGTLFELVRPSTEVVKDATAMTLCGNTEKPSNDIANHDTPQSSGKPWKRGRSQKQHRRSDYGTISSEILRFLLRLGLVPLVVSPKHFVQEVAAAVAENEITFEYEPGSARDPFVDLRLIDNSFPSSATGIPGVLLTRFRDSLDVRVILLADMRAAMYEFASNEAVFGPAEKHESIVSQYDIIEWCQSFEIRQLLLKNRQLLRERCGVRADHFDFERRAERGLDILCMVFLAILSTFRKGWFTTPRRNRHFLHWLAPPSLLAKIKSLGYPMISKAWVRILLFSCPAVADDQLCEQYERIFKIAENLEHLCLLQLSTIVAVPIEKLSELRRELDMEDDFPSQRSSEPSNVFSYDANRKNNAYLGKKEPYPWNRTLRWTENTDDLEAIVVSPDGHQTLELKPRHKEILEIIAANRKVLVQHCDKVCLNDIRNAQDGWVDRLASKIAKRCMDVMGVEELPAKEPKIKKTAILALDSTLAFSCSKEFEDGYE
jgi:hypothetical protein